MNGLSAMTGSSEKAQRPKVVTPEDGRHELPIHLSDSESATASNPVRLLRAAVADHRQRADENQKLADILQSVVKATNELAEELDFEVGINRWLRTLGENTDAVRASIYDTIGAQGGPDQHMRALAEWVRHGVGNSNQVSFAAPVVMPLDHASELWAAIVANKPLIVTPTNADPEMRAFLEAQGNKAVLCVPFLVGGRTWAVSFDFLVDREFDERTLATLQTAANSVATEILRRDAEKAKLAAEREHVTVAETSAQILARKRDLLEAVVATSEKLLAEGNLDAAAEWTCERIGRALDGDRVLIGRFLPPDSNSERGYCAWMYEWTMPSIARQTNDPQLRTIDMVHYADFHESFLRNEHLALITNEMESSRGQGELQSLGVQSLFAYPIFVDGALWGLLDVDDCRSPRVWDEGEIATLSLVASAIASTVERERLTQARIDAERTLSEDRNRIAREIHDTLAQGFTGVIMQTQAADYKPP
jgi:GAF domain-containing protein